MPTGYTCDIENDQSFEDYLLSCARAFGACMHQRDESGSVKPKLRSADTYHEQALLEAAADLGAFKTMNREQKEQAGQELKDEQEKWRQEDFNRKILLRNKYDAMAQKVQAWNPPTADHVNLKKFMLDQINESIRFDCDTEYSLKQLQATQSKTAMQFYEEHVQSLERDVKYHEEEHEKATKRNDEANKWIMALYDSLGIEYEA